MNESLVKYKKRINYGMVLFYVFLISLVPRVIMKNSGADAFLDLDEDSWMYISIPLAIMFLHFNFFLWRCPYCNKHPGRKFAQNKCKSCDKSLLE